MSISVYVHIPFCQQKCHYCDFVSYAGAYALHQPYIAALCREISGRGGILAAEGVTVSSVFVGGGTPTCLSANQLGELFACLNTNLLLTSDAEVSVEVNPGTIDEAKLAVLLQAGVNRLSIGVQSFDDKMLQTIGRIHTSKEAEQAVRLARRYGTTNINIDLMHGLPDQTIEVYKDSLETAVRLGIDHISAYSLIVEDETPIAQQLVNGSLSLPDPDTDAAMFELTCDYLVSNAYEHYEISNYAKPGKRCLHNMSYWLYKPYIGFGVAACSFDLNVRSTNTTDVSAYIESMRRGTSPVADRESIPLPVAMGEYSFLALRTLDGLSATEFTERFAIDFYAYYHNVLTNLINEGLIVSTADRIRLTQRGLAFGNRVFAAFLPE